MFFSGWLLIDKLIWRSSLLELSTSSKSGFRTHSLSTRRSLCSTRPPRRTSSWGSCTPGRSCAPWGSPSRSGSCLVTKPFTILSGNLPDEPGTLSIRHSDVHSGNRYLTLNKLPLKFSLQRKFRLHDGWPEVRLEQWTQLSADVTWRLAAPVQHPGSQAETDWGQ